MEGNRIPASGVVKQWTETDRSIRTTAAAAARTRVTIEKRFFFLLSRYQNSWGIAAATRESLSLFVSSSQYTAEGMHRVCRPRRGTYRIAHGGGGATLTPCGPLLLRWALLLWKKTDSWVSRAKVRLMKDHSTRFKRSAAQKVCGGCCRWRGITWCGAGRVSGRVFSKLGRGPRNSHAPRKHA